MNVIIHALIVHQYVHTVEYFMAQHAPILPQLSI